MALTDLGKKFLMENDLEDAAMYIGLSANGTSEQGATAGYARAAMPTGSANRAISAAGVLTLKAAALPMTIYTPNAGGAPDSSHAAVFSAASGADATTRLTDWTQFGTDIEAPVQGQPLRLTAFTMTP